MSDDAGKGWSQVGAVGSRCARAGGSAGEEVGEEVGGIELAVKLGTTKSSVFRHLKTLVERGYLSQIPQTSKYRLGIQTYVLGQVATRASTC